MPSLPDAKSTPLVKLLLVGNSKSGKTGALASLARAPFIERIGILDLDNKISSGILPILLRKEPEAARKISFMSFRDKMKGGDNGPVHDGVPSAFNRAMKAMDKWEDGTSPANWGPNAVFVLDTLTFLGSAALDWATAMNPTSKSGAAAYGETWYYTAQQAIEDVLLRLTSVEFNANVIVNSHITLQEVEGVMRGFPTAIGKKLSPKVPTFFEHFGVAEVKGTGSKASRVLRFYPTSFIEAATPLQGLSPELPIETGLASFFAEARR